MGNLSIMPLVQSLSLLAKRLMIVDQLFYSGFQGSMESPVMAP